MFPLFLLPFLLVLACFSPCQAEQNHGRDARTILKNAWTDLDEIYVFGDSLSDIGNFSRLTGGLLPAPPYAPGRFTNGPLWIEVLTEELGLTTDTLHSYAFGTAETGRGPVFQGFELGMLAQVDAFTTATPVLDPSVNRLFVLWGGANDYPGRLPENSVANLEAAVVQLATHGARRFLVVNLPDLGLVPSKSVTPQMASQATALSREHNARLAEAIPEWERTLGIEIAHLNIAPLFHDLVTRPGYYSLTNVTAGCYNQFTACGAPDTYLFWDGLHPTAAGHRILGRYAAQALQARTPSETNGWMAY